MLVDEPIALGFRACRRAAMSASLEATTARGSTFGPTTCSAPTGKRLSVAPATQPEGPGAMSMHRRASPCPRASHWLTLLRTRHLLTFQPTSTGACRRPATRSSGTRSSTARQWSPPSTSTPAGGPAAALVTRRARRPTIASTASIVVEAAANCDGCRALLAAERAREDTGLTLGL